MIDTIYQTLLTIINKENQGYVSPTEFNLLANTVQSEIFRGYFEDANRDKNRENKGLTNRGYGNLDLNERQRVQQFASSITLPATAGVVTLPADLYFIEDRGVITGFGETYPFKIIEETPRDMIAYQNQSDVAPSVLYPVYERFANTIKVYPTAIATVELRYLRIPAMPNWTYQMVSNQPMYNAGDVSHQDFEIHEGEFSNIVLKMLTFFGISLREADIVTIAEQMKDKTNLKENN
jgi:hypothetical protein